MYRAVSLGGYRGSALSSNQIALISDLSEKSIEKAAKSLVPRELRSDLKLAKYVDQSYRLISKTSSYSVGVVIHKLKNPKKFH